MARKTKYDKDTFPTFAEGYARQGLSDEQIAINLGITYSTFKVYIEEYPAFLTAIKRGRFQHFRQP